MNADRIHHCVANRLLWLVLPVWLAGPLAALAEAVEHYDVLQVGTQTYSNVTVTTKAQSYVFILHSGGMASLKVSALPPELRETLGYAVEQAPKAKTNTAASWAKTELARINPQVKDLEKQLQEKWQDGPATRLAAMGLIGSKPNWTVLGVALGLYLLLYLFFCYCCMLICRKTGNPPGPLVWLPVLKVFPMLRAAGMSGWWFLGFFVPVFNLIPAILWPLRIAQARGKSVWIGVLLLLPVTNLFAFLYLAFSNDAGGAEDNESESKVMSLQRV